MRGLGRRFAPSFLQPLPPPEGALGSGCSCNDDQSPVFLLAAMLTLLAHCADRNLAHGPLTWPSSPSQSNHLPGHSTLTQGHQRCYASATRNADEGPPPLGLPMPFWASSPATSWPTMPARTGGHMLPSTPEMMSSG